MIDYEVLCQTIEDWRAGRRPSIDLSSTLAAPPVEQYAEPESEGEVAYADADPVEYAEGYEAAPEYEAVEAVEGAVEYTEEPVAEGYAEGEAQPEAQPYYGEGQEAPAEQVQYAEQAQYADQAQHADQAQYAEPAEHAEPVQYAEHADQAQYAEPAEHAEPVQYAEPVEYVEGEAPTHDTAPPVPAPGYEQPLEQGQEGYEGDAAAPEYVEGGGTAPVVLEDVEDEIPVDDLET